MHTLHVGVCRATRGNMFLRQTPVGSVKDPATGEQQEKHVFVVFYAGERARTKVLKVRGVWDAAGTPGGLAGAMRPAHFSKCHVHNRIGEEEGAWVP